MDKSKIEDSWFLIQHAYEDLRSLRSVMQNLESQTDCLDSQDVLVVATRALGPIIGDIRKAVDTIGGELEKEKNDAGRG